MAGVYTTTTPDEIASYIRQQASARGINPSIAVEVSRHEGLNSPIGDSGQSFGPFQFFTGGGMGNSFLKDTGLRVQDYESNWRQQVQYALNYASQHGWNPGGVGLGAGYVSGTGSAFHGASVAGISNWEGLLGSHSLALDFSNTGGSQQTPSDNGSAPPTGDLTVPGFNPNPTVPPQFSPGQGTPANLGFADSIKHIVNQSLLVLIGLVLLIGGIYLLGRK